MHKRGKRPMPKTVCGLGLAIRAIRDRLGFTQTNLGQRLGWPRNIISQYEAGSVYPSAERLIALLRIAETDEERRPILKVLEVYGVRITDLSPGLLSSNEDASVAADMAPVCGEPDRIAMSDSPVFSDKGMS